MTERTALLDDEDHFHESMNNFVSDDASDVLIKSGRESRSSRNTSRASADVPPIDRYNFVYGVFYTFGMCSVLPWNMFITAQNYFDYKFAVPGRNATHFNCSDPGGGPTCSPGPAPGPHPDLHAMYESYFSIAAQVPNVVIQLLNTALQHKITLKIRMITSLTGMLVIFIFTTVMTRVDTFAWQKEFFFVTLGSVVLINCFSAVFQGSVFGIGGLLPKRFTQALMAGQGLGGIIPALVSIICLATLDDNSLVGFVYFLLAVVCIFITFAVYLLLLRNQFAEYYLNRQANTDLVDVSMSNSFELQKTTKPPFWLIISKIWLPGFMVFLTFAATLGNFPGVVSQIESMQPTEWSEKYFTPVFCFLLFNALDFTGRSLSFIQLPSQKHMGIVSILVLLRLGFFPLFALCNVSPATRESEVVFTHDAYYIIFMVVFAISNGYLSSLCMMYGPKFVKTEYQETAGNMMAFFLVLGLATGSAISLGVLRLI